MEQGGCMNLAKAKLKLRPTDAKVHGPTGIVRHNCWMPGQGLDSGTRMEHWRAGDLELNVGLQRVLQAGSPLELTRLSLELLLALIRAAPNFVSNEELMHRVWPGLVVSPETVTQRVKLLRDALGDDPPEADNMRSHERRQ